MPARFADQIAADRIEADEFRSRVPPQHTGNASPIAYGGCSTAGAVYAACQTVDARFRAYTILGSFLGPTMTDRDVLFQVKRIRDTRNFATRHILAIQKQNDGSERACTQVMVDFHVSEPALLSYQPPPPHGCLAGPYDRASALPSSLVLQNSVDSGLIPPDSVDAYRKFYSMMDNYFDAHYLLQSVGAQNAIGLAKSSTTSQDHLPMHEKSCAAWWGLKEPLHSYAENLAALCFLMDGGLSFLPLHLNHMDQSDSSACSTLDFALRIITSEVRFDRSVLKERKTIAAREGRTLSEQRLWSPDGHLIATMSQTCILRPALPHASDSGARL